MHLVWDLGNVLVRWRPLEIVRRALPHRPDDAQALARTVFGHPDGEWSRYDRGLLDLDGVVAGIAARTPLTPHEVAALVAEVSRELVALPDAVALLDRVRPRTGPMFFLSNMPAPEADRLERENPWLRRFADGVFSARVHVAKPEPALFALARERFGVPADDLLLLDDHAPNVAAARAAGWQAELWTGVTAGEALLTRHGLLPSPPSPPPPRS